MHGFGNGGPLETISTESRAVLFDLGNTLVTYYATGEFPPVLQRCLQECRDVLGWSPDPERDRAMFVRAMGLNAERPDGAVHALDERLSQSFGEQASLDDSIRTAVCDAILKPIFDLARLDPDALSVLESGTDRSSAISRSRVAAAGTRNTLVVCERCCGLTWSGAAVYSGRRIARPTPNRVATVPVTRKPQDT